MQRFIQSAARVSAMSIIACALALVGASEANAQPKGMPEGYLGVGLGFNDSSSAAGLNGRISFPKAKVSLRGSLYGGCDGDCALFIPTVTYDLPVAKNTNIYLGAGYASVSTSSGDYLGSEGVLQAGAETGIGKKFVMYGDGTFADGGSLWKVGLGYRL